MPGKSKLTADASEQATLRALSKSEHRGEADRARAILLTLEGRKAEEIAAVLGVHVSTVRNWRGYFAHGGVAGLRRRQRPGQQAKIGPQAGAIAAAILNDDVRHDGGWTLVRLCAEIARRGGPAFSPWWLAHQLRQRFVWTNCAKGLCGPRVIAERARAVDSAAIRAIVVRWLAPSEV
jgi:transposase